MVIRCDNPTCSSKLELVDFGEGLRVNQLSAAFEAAITEAGWTYVHDSVRWVANCPRCTRDLAYA